MQIYLQFKVTETISLPFENITSEKYSEIPNSLLLEEEVRFFVTIFVSSNNDGCSVDEVISFSL